MSKCPHCSKPFADEELLRLHIANQHVVLRLTDSGLDELARECLTAFLKSDGKDQGLLAKAKQANAYRSTEARRDQTQGAREATLIMMARELTESKSEFRKLMSIAMPKSKMIAAVTEEDSKEHAS